MAAAVPTSRKHTASEAAFAAAWDQFFAAVRRARGRAAQESEPGSLTLAQFQLLAAFEDERELTVGELALAGGVAPPTATRMLAMLERDGVVTREPSADDGRRVTVRLSAKGRRLLAAKRKRIAAKQRAIFAALSAEERRQAETILRSLATAMEGL